MLEFACVSLLGTYVVVGTGGVVYVVSKLVRIRARLLRAEKQLLEAELMIASVLPELRRLLGKVDHNDRDR